MSSYPKHSFGVTLRQSLVTIVPLSRELYFVLLEMDLSICLVSCKEPGCSYLYIQEGSLMNLHQWGLIFNANVYKLHVPLLKLKLLTSYMSQISYIPGKADVSCHYTRSIFSFANLNYDNIGTFNFQRQITCTPWRKLILGPLFRT